MWIDRLTQAVVLLLLVFATQGNNPYDHQAKTKKSCPGNHRHHLPSRESDQTATPLFILTYFAFINERSGSQNGNFKIYMACQANVLTGHNFM